MKKAKKAETIKREYFVVFDTEWDGLDLLGSGPLTFKEAQQKANTAFKDYNATKVFITKVASIGVPQVAPVKWS